MVLFSLVIINTMDYSPWSNFRWPYSAGDAMDYIVHGPLYVGHTQQSMPWTVVYGPLSVDHSRYHELYSMVDLPFSKLGG